MVAPCYFLGCRIFRDAGVRLRAVGEGSEGIDLEALERGLKEGEREGEGQVRAFPFCLLLMMRLMVWESHVKGVI